jgi:nucleotide-binding universal stress UspA family protein
LRRFAEAVGRWTQAGFFLIGIKAVPFGTSYEMFQRMKPQGNAVMNYRSILVNLDIDEPVAPLVEFAVDFAARFKARLIGFSAADARLPFAGPEGGAIAAEVWEQEKKEIEHRLKEVRGMFENLAANKVKTEWREIVGDPTRSLAETARLADLIVTAARRGASSGDAYRAIDPGTLALQAGRPVLIAANGADHLITKKAVIAWKDTREARRAVADAVPLLQSAEDVTVVTVDRDPDDAVWESVSDVVSYLKHHRIRTRSEVFAAKDENERLGEFITGRKPDLVVSGAYGHSRLREWAFGGVTRYLLDEIGINRLMAS